MKKNTKRTTKNVKRATTAPRMATRGTTIVVAARITKQEKVLLETLAARENLTFGQVIAKGLKAL